MSKILSLDTSSDYCSVCVYLDGETLFKGENAPRQHAQLLMPMIESVLADSGLSLSQFDAVAFGAGPGSFTGLRISAGVTQGLAFGADLPTIPVSTLAALAYKALQSTEAPNALVTLDARMQEVYWACYRRTADNKGVELLGDENVTAAEKVVLPPALEGECIGAGSGFEFIEQFAAECRKEVLSLDANMVPDALGVAMLAEKELNSGSVLLAEQAIPRYIRNEVAWQKLPGRE